MRFDKARITLILISSLPIIIGALLSSSVVSSATIGQIISESRTFTPIELIVMGVVQSVMGVFVVLTLFYLLSRRGRGVQKIAVAFVVSPILFLVYLFLGQSILILIFKGTSDAFQGILLILSLGISMLSIVLIMIDAIPPTIRNLFVAFYGSTFGTFLGLTTVTASMSILILSLIVEDFFLTKYNPIVEAEEMDSKIGSDPFDYTRIDTESVVIGVGDFVAFSLIAAHSVAYFPVFVAILSMLMMFTGILINITILSKEGEILPAIPLPAILAVIPWFLYIASYIALGG
jgi:hypothetical protein